MRTFRCESSMNSNSRNGVFGPQTHTLLALGEDWGGPGVSPGASLLGGFCPGISPGPV
jgi:hypothetical protein